MRVLRRFQKNTMHMLKHCVRESKPIDPRLILQACKGNGQSKAI